jgi:SAM-dependent methyltransferase
LADKDDARIVPVNTRSPAQWAAMRDALDWKGKWVLDVGCGYGDLLLFAREAGAHVFGVDHNEEVVKAATGRGLPVVCADINEYMERGEYGHVVFCFSVLPYNDCDRTLANLAKIADVAFIEVQLLGDGPGYFASEDQLRETLEGYWDDVTRVGETQVQIRNTIRAIWMCRKGETGE